MDARVTAGIASGSRSSCKTGAWIRASCHPWKSEDSGRCYVSDLQQVKALHGRKSDRRDCQRIAEFLQDRRLDPSFVPPLEIRRLRALLRFRSATSESTAWTQE